MYLKEIELENFKSFGRRITIPFLKGFTAITGPNGSGKSNIGDAILFVLGPRSSKAIRAKNLSDLIFNGGKSKKPAKFCKASLIFDNEDRIIPIDQNDVKLTRLVRRSKSAKDKYNSYFYVNGKPSSQNEFENLLAHARISADGYNLVQQGDINRITQLSPVDRRRMLDDVAGITKFDKDIGRAEKKRDDVEGNLEKIGIRVDEIKRQLKELDKDRSDALKYNDLKEKLSRTKILFSIKKRESFELEISTLEEQITKFEQNKIDAEEKTDDLRKKRQDTIKRLEEVENKLADLSGDEAEELKKKIQEIKLNQFRARDSAGDAKNDIEDYNREKLKITSDLKTSEKELKQYEQKLADVEGELSKSKERKEQLDADLKELEDLASKSDSDLLSMRREITQLIQTLDTKREDIHKCNLNKERLEDRLNRLEADMNESEELIKKYEFEIQDNAWQLKELSKPKDESDSVNNLESRLIKARETEKKLSFEAQDLEEAILTLTRQHTAAKMHVDTAKMFQKGYNRAVETILEARDTGKLKGILGTIAELGNVDEKYEDALTIAAGSRMQSIVVDNDESAAKAMIYLKKNKYGRATFLPLNKMVTGKPNARAIMAVDDENTVGFAIDLVEFDQKYKSAFWYVFGDTVVAKSLSSARKLMGGVRLVTIDGELIEASGAMIGGTIPQKALKFGAPSDSEIKNIRDRLRKATEHADSVAKQLLDVKTAIIEIEDKLRKSSAHESTLEQKKKDLESERVVIDGKLSISKDDFSRKCDEFDNFKKELEATAKTVNSLSEQFAKLEEDRDAKQELMLKATDREMAEKINDFRDELIKLKENINDLTSNEKTLQMHIKLYRDKCGEYQVSISEIEKKIEDNTKKIDENKELYSDYDDQLNKMMKVEESMSKDQLKLNDERDKLKERTIKLEGELEKVDNKKNSLNDLIVNTGISIQNVNTELAEVINEIQMYDFEEEEFSGEKKTLDELKKSIPEFERRLDSLQPVNLRAIDEYNRQNERLESLNTDVEQLEVQKENLNVIVNELKTKKKDGLMIVFNAVNENFKEIFNQVSIGGTAELILENPKDPFDAGLIIRARPRNKKFMRLEALSGGEKSLTALALIFSIQRYQPSPFYVLDEVDMFLDAINAENVGRMITKNAEIAQFILVSLRKVTFKDANHVYGVTMQGTGISYLVGKVNLTEVGEDGEIMKDLEDTGGGPPEDIPEVTGG